MMRVKIPITPRFEVIPSPLFGHTNFILLDHEAAEHGHGEADDPWSAYAGMFDRKREAVREAMAIMFWENVVITFPPIEETKP